ncbi:MAG: carboxylesterase family protein [Myxococcales bacterium FL481]|nr:MAG: carboxylesterase family protein [Myxococcales bacterium FL481]
MEWFSRASNRPSAAPTTERQTDQGRVVGFLAENGGQVWRGIPFAASTAGANRWRAPQPAPAWDGVREAIDPAPRCAQLTNEFDKNEGHEPGQVIGTEDCLTLDIYSPSHASAGSVPVMVWIHGGGNVWGRSSKYDGSRLANNEAVVLVAVQYRVGPLGWFAHEWLRRSAETPEDAAACFALLDIIAALRWLRDNIARFGGNPDCVTIFGESAGGHNVVALLASPLARGLFHRAIVQSGVFDSTPRGHAEGETGDLVNPAQRIVERLGVPDAKALRAVPVAQLWQAYERGSGFVDVPRVIQDGVVLPRGPMREAFASKATFAAVPIMMGTNHDEMKLFYMRDDRVTKRRLGVFVVARDQPAYDALTRYLTRLWRIRAVNEPAAMMHAAGHDAVYAYRFDWDDGGRVLFTDFHELLGAAHGFEIPFVFNRFEHLGDADRFLFQDRTAEDRERLSRTIGAYWASFARDGVPSCREASPWPEFGDCDGSFLRFDTAAGGGIEVIRGCDQFSALMADLRAETRVDRSFVVEEMNRWMFGQPVREQILRAME